MSASACRGTAADGLDAHVVVERPAFRLDVRLRVPAGSATAVVGPNGAGKSTLLRALAGLAPLTAGRVALDGRVLEEPGGGAARIPAEGRGIGVVFQDHLLFPHLSALQNVAFGPRAHGVPRADADDRARALLDRLGIAQLADRRPAALSGGQSQRVALARALVLEPALLLLDEPMAALDAGTRLDVRDLLADELRRFGGAAVMVTHDPVDALALTDRIHVLEDGRQVQEGAPAEVAARPATAYVARLVGMNRLTGRDADGQAVVIIAAPADVRLARGPAPEGIGGGTRDVVTTGTVRRVEGAAGRVRVALRVAEPDAAVTALDPAAVAIEPGTEITAELDAASFAALRPVAAERLTVRIPRGI
ncbi:ABC transporter ATP-binding protein [Clavibacter sepedonicus]|uniref:ABC transporter ATP-binding subunit n=1 Tax=Clavibacter sepedonicus TaxID=31964 RepID=B0RHP3_CLASE|nr:MULTISPECIES: ABC transporter ATP-binding protein [Clavibacter]MBD5382286.1 ABC transporter ATP-binding protein [Clavibacter sp.]OQJ49533.1 molybdenum ABC transporter ATP-binding protein [Clavibacter sepedonicus]OQJ55510.1 molybdenum ABC transporter ATP-binding protein [Clavibacter sepedonicus]UUK66153.1 ABC transporter ATP-binding protein [Clavibacter sepedonicus]CAQ02604.1 putative ABC transporter ATP-binding subunit [Clavibacter sepedonicus]